jgi:hypothetical protein
MKPSVGSVLGALVGAAVLVLGGLAEAQPQPGPSQGPPSGAEFGTRAPAPPPAGVRPPEIRLEPTRPLEETRPWEQEFYPGVLIRSQHEPAFIQPFVTSVPVSPTSEARVGLSGWTAPAPPINFPNAGGGLAFGLTITWGAPPTPKAVPEPEGGGQR